MLDSNEISNVDALGNLTSLKRLFLNNNKISDASALSNLTSLKQLKLNNNENSGVSNSVNLTSKSNPKSGSGCLSFFLFIVLFFIGGVVYILWPVL
jgi:Leucine-rich repeat (LRR) protein